jgi:8-oxo-dGTP pyrophosphatase MutT (NUDIX family)
MTNSSFATYIDRLCTRLTAPLPGAEAQLKMAPAYRAEASVVAVEDKDCREAGVLVLLFPAGNALSIVLTVRRDHLPDHAGQIAFPGGQRERGETLRETALREAHEEVALDPACVDVLGMLTPLYIPPSNFCVHPFVGVAPEPLDLRPTDDEVGAILRVPIAHLLGPAALRRETWTLHGQDVEVPFFDVGGHKVWGATAMMLAELLALCKEVFPDAA